MADNNKLYQQSQALTNRPVTAWDQMNAAGGAGVPATARHNIPQLDSPSFVWTFDPKTVQDQLTDPNKRRAFKGLETEIKNTQKWLLANGYKQEDIPSRSDFEEPWYWRALEFLRRPQYITNSIFDLMLDGKFDPYLYTKAIGASATGDLTIEGRDLVVKAFGGALREQFGDKADAAASVIGLAWDIVADPLNFLGIGFAAKSKALVVGGPKLWGVGIAAPTKIGDMAQTFSRIGGIIIDESGKAIPHVAEMAPQLFAKTEKARKTGMLTKLFGGGRLNLTADEAKQLEKFKGVDAPAILAAQSKYGQEAVRAFEAGVLDSYVAARTIGEKIDKNQWALVSVMGRSILTPAVEKKIYQAGAALIGGANDLARQIPGVAKFADLAGDAAMKGKALFSTSAEVMAGLNKARGKEDLAKTAEGFDQMFHASSNLSRNLSAEGLVAMKKLQRLTKGWSRDDIMKYEDALEHPMVGQIREHLLMDPNVRARFIQTLRKNGFDDPILDSWIDPNKMQDLLISVSKGDSLAPQGGDLAKVMKDVAPGEINAFFSKLHEGIDLAKQNGNLLPETNWKKVWDESMAEFTKYGGDMFGDFGKQLDIAEATSKMVSGLSPNAQEAVKFARNFYKSLSEREMNAGVLSSLVEGYSPHLMQPMDHDVGNLIPMIVGIKARSVKMGSSLHREHWLKFPDFINYLEKERAGGEAVADWIGANLDPALRMGLRAAGRSPKAVEQSYLFRESAKRWGQTGTKIGEDFAKAGGKLGDEAAMDVFAAEKGMRRLDPMLRARARQFIGDDVFFDDDIAGVLEKHLELQTNVGKQSELAKGIRMTTALWKGWTLGVRPAFHFRNFISMQIHNSLAGISNPADLASSLFMSNTLRSKMGAQYKDGIWDAAKFTGKWWDQTLVSKTGKVHTMRELAEGMQKNGVHGTGLFSADNPAQIADAMRPGTMNPLSQRNYVTRAGFAMGNRVEDTGRGQLFLHKVLEEGMDYRAASKEVAKWHFDYSDLTTFEKDIRDFVFPFYAWSRKNMPLQMELLLTRPTAMTWIDKSRKAFEETQEPIDYYGVQKWMKDSLPVRWRHDPETGDSHYMVLKNWIPAADMQEMCEPWDLALQMLSPVIKLPIEMAADDGKGYSFFFKQPIERYPGQTRTLLGIEMGAKKQYALKTIGAVSALDQLIPTSVQDVVHQRLYGEPMMPPFDEPTMAARGLRFFTGAKVYKDSPARVMMSNEYQYRDYLRALKKEQKTRQERIDQKGVK